MRECPRCEVCYEDNVEICPQDQVGTKNTLPGPRLLASRYLLEKRLGRGAIYRKAKLLLGSNVKRARRRRFVTRMLLMSLTSAKARTACSFS
jgi:hypothetical protein